MKNARYLCQILRKLEFSRYILEKHSNITFNENCLVGAELFHEDGQTARQRDSHTDALDESNRHFS